MVRSGQEQKMADELKEVANEGSGEEPPLGQSFIIAGAPKQKK